jgi:hypothetical protein
MPGGASKANESIPLMQRFDEANAATGCGTINARDFMLNFSAPSFPAFNAKRVETQLFSSEKPSQKIIFGKHEWRVLDVENERALLLSDKITHVKMPYNEDFPKADMTWDACTLRKWLNSGFIRNEFTAEESERILETTLANENNPWFPKSKGGNPTNDKIFLLSIAEVVRYFGGSGQLENRNPDSRWWIDDGFNNGRTAKIDGTETDGWWWLRSPGYYGKTAATVCVDGNIYIRGNHVLYNRVYGGVRPALWLSLSPKAH